MRPLQRGRGLAVRGDLGSFIRAVSVLRRAVRHSSRPAAGSEGEAEPSGVVYSETLDVLHIPGEMKRRVG